MLLAASIVLAESANDSFNLGYEKHLMGDVVTAVRLYSKAIENNPSFAMAYQMRGIAQQQLKKYPQAISDYSMVITFGEPLFKSVGYYNRGIVKNMIGDFVGAIPDFSQAIELDKKMAAAFFHRGIAKSKTGDLSGQLSDFREAARLGDSNAERWLKTYAPGWKVLPVTSAPT
jgi:tetratricopeptide (TPR) repeat protein